MPAGPPDYFLPESGAVLTHLLIVRDVDRSREFYRTVLDAAVVRERDPCILRFENGYIVLNTEGGPTDDKPDVAAVAPADSRTLSSAMNIRVTDVRAIYERWRSCGAQFLTEPRTTTSRPAATCATRTGTSSRWARRPASSTRCDPGAHADTAA